ncbi:MAG: hypothetical protein AMJ66_11875 [Betaproteobacteria bacterium SG8_40]|nr:MAG: hypothetical protein AMJ66_11875 [Betaproteobacteria bacterium SG8_40]
MHFIVGIHEAHRRPDRDVIAPVGIEGLQVDTRIAGHHRIRDTRTAVGRRVGIVVRIEQIADRVIKIEDGIETAVGIQRNDGHVARFSVECVDIDVRGGFAGNAEFRRHAGTTIGRDDKRLCVCLRVIRLDFRHRTGDGGNAKQGREESACHDPLELLLESRFHDYYLP